MRTSRLRVAVIGSGTAGLTVAAALKQLAVECVIFERATVLREVGAGIQLSPNATRPLYQLGLGPALDVKAVRPHAIEMRRWRDGHLLLRTELGQECARRYQAPYLTVHRADLQHTLVSLATSDADLRLGHECVGVDEGPDEVELRFANGARFTADLVIGADGIHSVIRQGLVADQPRFSGQAVYRGLVPAERLPDVASDPRVRIWLGPGRHCVYYPISAGRLISFVATAPAPQWRTESWTAPGDVAELLAGYEGWSAHVQRVLGAADAVTRWAIHDRDSVPSWSTERITLIGDAAHPMLPFGAQRASQAIEDAVALAAALRQAPGRIGMALKRYEAVRIARTEQVHRTMRENTRNHHYSDGEEQQARDRMMPERWGLAAQAWLYGYDAASAVSQEG